MGLQAQPADSPLCHGLVAAFAGRRWRLLSCWYWGAWVSRPRWSRCGRNQVADSDRFVATMSPVILDPAVQSALTNRISSEVLGYIDVEKLANDVVDSLAAQGLRPQLVDS